MKKYSIILASEETISLKSTGNTRSVVTSMEAMYKTKVRSITSTNELPLVNEWLRFRGPLT